MLRDTDWAANKPLIIAHRGASKIAPENTMAAFRMAAQLGADAIELDAKLSEDGAIVVHHDSTLDRTTSGSGPLSSLKLQNILELDAGSHFSEEFASERIPTLEEVLDVFGDQLLVNVELTNYGHPFDDLPVRVAALVRKFGLERRVLFSSFNPIALWKVKRMAPEIPAGLLLLQQEPEWMRSMLRRIAPHEALHPQEQLINRDVVVREHAMGRIVSAWTVNDAGRLRELLEIGVDGIITDVPDLAREILIGGAQA
jgi:glycerophosphoryl diester phosphodiesterase